MSAPRQQSADDRADAAAVNPCSLCAPLGASLAFKGVAGAMTLLHGSQGCATYIRRYLISHFREPVDIASSNFTEDTVVFGGASNLREALIHVQAQYRPALIGVATTCLAETIGDDTTMPIRDYLAATAADDAPVVVPVSTPSYRDAHVAGFVAAAAAIIRCLVRPGVPGRHLAIIPGILSPADLRYLREIADSFGNSATIFPDYSATLDGGTWTDYAAIPEGGTPIAEIAALGTAAHLFDWTAPGFESDCGAAFLHDKFNTPMLHTAPPIGVRATDRFLETFARASGVSIPEWLKAERGRLLDAYVDGHKYVSGKRAIIFGDEPLVVALAGFFCEIGIVPVLCATGSRNSAFTDAITAATENRDDIRVMHNADTDAILGAAAAAGADLVVGSSKGLRMAQALSCPLVRVGFPVHDRFGAARQLHIGYRGTQELFDRMVNAIIARQQETDSVSYAYY
ncbi:MAG: hypothetical protein MUF22_08825 [Chitinispirillaceae bacterium]|jgi:nitrogenase molybdenum-iron protein NifN|nr:hypothetical protein [Chitinispirillaceae bacterium]